PITVQQKAKRRASWKHSRCLPTYRKPASRHDNVGQPIPRNIITNFTATYNGKEIFRADLYPAIAANPFVSFFTTATESGTIAFEWTGDNGFHETGSAKIAVEG